MADSNTFQVSIAVDKTQLAEGFDASVADSRSWSERLGVIFGEAEGSSKRAVNAISDSTKEMAAQVTPEQERVAEATRRLTQAQLDLRNANKLVANGTMDAVAANRLQAAAIAEVAAAERDLKGAKATALAAVAPSQAAPDQSAAANAVVSSYANGASSEASHAVAVATLEDIEAKTQLKTLKDSLAESTLTEAEQTQALAEALERERATTFALASAKAALTAEDEILAEAEAKARAAAEANAAIQERAAAAAAAATPAQLELAAATLANTDAQKQLKEVQDQVAGSTASEAEKVAALSAAQTVAAGTSQRLAAAQSELSGASHKAVTDIQATQGAIAGLEGRGGIRAIEAFTSKTLGLGPAIQAIFPILGAGLFLQMLFDIGEKVEDVAEKALNAGREIERSLENQHEKNQVNLDDLALTSQRLQDQIDKISGHPNNGLADALLEAKKMADSLLESLNADKKSMDDLFKQNSVGTIASIFTGVASTGKIDSELDSDFDKFKGKIKGINDSYEQEIAKDKTPEALKAAGERRVRAIQAATSDELGAKQRERQRLAQEQKDSEDASVASSNAGEGSMPTPIKDNSAKVGHLDVYSQQIAQVGAVAAAQAQITDQQATLGTAKQGKEQGAADRKAEEEANKAAEAKFKGFEAELAEWKTLAPVSAAAEFDFWQARRDAFDQGAQQYNAVVAKQAEIAVASARKAHEEIAKQEALDKRNDEEGSEALIKSGKGMDEWRQQITNNLFQTGAAWDGYWKDVAKGQEISARMAEESQLASLKARESAGAITGVGAAMATASIHAEENRRALAALREELERLQREGAKSADPLTGKVTDPKIAGQIAQVQNQIAEQQGKGAAQAATDTAAITQQIAKPYLDGFNLIENGWMKSQQAMLVSHKSFAQAMTQMWDGIAMSALENIEKVGLHFVQREIMMTAQKQAAKATQVAVDASGAAASTGIAHAQNAEQGLSAAKLAFKNTYASVSSWPVVGPVLAPVLAGAAFAAVEAFEMGGVVGGAQGMAVPILAHAGERVLTAQQTNQFHTLLEGGGSRRGGDVNVNLNGDYNFHGGSGSQGNFKSMLSDHADHIGSIVQDQMRDNKL